MKRIFLFFIMSIFAFGLEFSVGKNGKSLDDNNTVLIFGGIQGDEPGGFHAASLLLSDYNITKGKIIVAPNLAFDSIIKRNRGNNGDLNRKFAKISKNDPDYKTIQRIKELILLPEVGMVINLHDGWGFYSPTYVDELKNPKRWGNSSVIDTSEINASKYKDLEDIAQKAVNNVNSYLVDPKHKYHLKNTKTYEKNDKEMLKALTYFVISNNKAAFANEASKNLPVHLRAYYHLLAIENYLKTANIEFTRDFELTPQGVKEAINKQISIKLFNDKILLLIKNSRKSINFLPFPINEKLTYQTNNELTAIIAENNYFYIQYGNRFQSKIYPEYFEFSNAINNFKIVVDNEEKTYQFATKISIKRDFLIPKMENIRVNIIGFNHSQDESGILVSKKNMQKKYSLDLEGRIYRVEFYECKNSNLSQNKNKSNNEKIIKNAPILSKTQIEKAKEKDKFLGSVLVEFE